MATDIGIDIGTSKTVIFSSTKIILEMDNMVTVDAETYEPIYFGEKAKQTLGRTPDSLICVSPIERGVIADYEIAEAMLKKYMNTAFGNKIFRPRILATLPAGLTELQHHSLANLLESAGGRNISVVEGPLAVAFGLGIDTETPHGTLIVDIGAGTTDIAVISMGGITVCDSLKIASLDFDNQIARYVRKEYNIEIGPLTAEFIKIKIGAAVKRDIEVAVLAKGRNVFTGLPESFEISSGEVYDAINETVNSVCDGIRQVLNRTDPDLVADITDDGFYLTGGGSQLCGLPEKISKYLGIKVHTMENPSYSVVKGAAVALKKKSLLKNVDYQLRSIRELEIK